MSADATPLRARIGFGEVRHRRLAPVEHAFAYPTCFLMLPMRSLRRQADATLARNRRSLFGFRDADHGDGRADSLAWFDELLAGDTVDFGRTLAAAKVFHVSPFCETRGEYTFRFMRTDLAARDERGRTAVRIELRVDGAPLLLTSVSGRIEPLAPAAVRFALWTLPAMTAAIVARIHWQALRLWLKKLPIVGKPARPATAVTRGAPSAGATQDDASTTTPSPQAHKASSARNPA